MSTLGDLLGGIVRPSAAATGDAFLRSFGMLRNPFPPARTIYPEVIYNQEKALEAFAQRITAVVGESIQRRSLAILGGTGEGKSHFQRHCQYETARFDLPLVTVEFLAGTGSSPMLVRDVLRAADEFVKRRTGDPDLLAALVASVEGGDLGPIRQSDLRAALRRLVEARDPGYVPKDMYGRFDFATLQEVCRRWIAGETLTTTEKRYLGVSARLSSGPLMVRVMTELFALARDKGFFRGVLICLDEVEALFSSGLSASRVQSFLQDLRYLFDESLGQSSGYSLLVLAGSTARGASELSNYNYPVFQRLGFEVEARVQLHQVANLDEMRAFADVYLRHEHARASDELGTASPSVEHSLSLVDDEDLREAFEGSAGSQGADERNQARLLEQLHQIVERKRELALS